MGDATTKVTNLIGLPANNAAGIRFDIDSQATSYDYRVGGGAVTNVTINKVYVQGLTNGTPALIEVRPNYGSTNGAWSGVTVTPVNSYVMDLFDRANVAPGSTALGNSTDGKTWNGVSGTGVGITSFQAYVSDTTENVVQVAGAYDVDITVKFNNAQNVSGNEGSIMFRYRSANTYWLLSYANNSLSLIYRNAGTLVTYYTLTSPGTTSLAGAVIRLLAVGNTLMVYVNGVLKMVLEDVVSVSTDTGLGYRGTGGASRVDFLVAKPGALPNPNSQFYKGRDTAALDTQGAA